jgi:gas vesicle protein
VTTVANTLKSHLSGISDADRDVVGVTKFGAIELASKLVSLYPLARLLGGHVGLTRQPNKLAATVRFASGFAIGLGAGMIFAPSSGKVLREQIVGAVRRTFAPAIDRVDQAAHNLAESIADVGHVAHDPLATASDASSTAAALVPNAPESSSLNHEGLITSME